MVRARSSRLVRHGRRVDCGTSEYSRYVPSRIAAVVVTHNRSGVLLNALRAIAGQTRPPDALYVVDNASEDDTAERLQREFPAAVYLRLHDNAGAAGGVAAGMRAAYTDGFDGFWLMDDDSEPEPQALESLLSAKARASTRTGIIGFGGG